MLSTAIELFKRHGSLHYANVKFGYIILLLSLIHLSFIAFSRRVYLKKWITSGRSTTFRRVNSVPDVIILGVWGVLIVLLLFYKFKVEHITVFIKRLGRISYALFPLDIFLSFKPNPLPNIYYLELVFLHKWISRMIIVLALIHSVGFSIVWLKRGTFSKILNILNFLGVLSMVLFLISSVVSLKPLRRRFYKSFFTIHLMIAWVVTILLKFHARPGVTFYTLVDVGLFIIQIVTKVIKSKDVKIEKLSNSNSSLEIIQFQNIFSERYFTPGSHLRLSYPKRNPLNYLLPSHPFTISSRSEDLKVKLIIRKNSLTLNTGDIHSIFGPFDSLHSNFFKTADHVLLVSGGAGISYTLGIYQELVRNDSVTVSLIWIVRNHEDLWILDHFDIKKIDIYITGSPISEEDNEFSDENENLLNDDDDFELENIDPFSDSNGIDEPLRVIKYGRPNFGTYTCKIDQYDRANNWVVCCGNQGLNSSTKEWAEKLKVRFHSEAFDL